MPDESSLKEKNPISLRKILILFFHLFNVRVVSLRIYMGADKSLTRPGRKPATTTEDFYVHIAYL